MQQKNRIKAAKKILDNIVNRLRQDYEPEQIILFGSYAYGKPTDESDLDLLIVKDTSEPILARWMKVRKLVSDLRIFCKGVRSYMSDESSLPEDWFKKPQSRL